MHPVRWNINQSSWYLVADCTDVVVLLQLCVARCGEALDLVYGVSPEQEALPTQLGSEPDIIVRVDQDDGAAHHAPLPKHCLGHTVAHHTHRNLPQGRPSASGGAFPFTLKLQNEKQTGGENNT